jgi:hypothetical protein
MQLLLSAEEMKMMIALASNGPHDTPGRVAFPTFLRITEMTQWY